MNEFTNFLTLYTVTSGHDSNFTHCIQINNLRRIVNIPHSAHYQFMMLYKNAKNSLQAGQIFYIIERPVNKCSVFIDVDFKHVESSRQYTLQTIKDLLSTYNNELSNLHFNNSRLESFVLEKQNPEMTEGSTPPQYKDGFHIIYPNVKLTIDEQKELSIKVNLILSTHPLLSNKIDVTCLKSGLVMYGSKKPNKLPYLLTHILDSELHEVVYQTHTCSGNLENYLSLRS